MFLHIRRHQKWLFIVISALTILSFVWFFSPQDYWGGAAGSGTSGAVGTIYGKPVSRQQYLDAHREAQLRYLFSYGEWPGNDEVTRQMGVVERETNNRLLLKQKIKEHKIHVTDAQVSKWITEAFRERDQQTFKKENYENFVKQRLPQAGMRVTDLHEFIRTELGIQHLINITGAAGKLVTPQEAEAAYRLENQEVQAEAVLFNASNYVAQVTIDPAALGHFYTNQSAMYRLPERVQLTYVEFKASNYVAAASERMNRDTNLAQRIDQIYMQRGANFYMDTNGQAMPPAAAKEQIKAEMLDSVALHEARRAAIDFAGALLDLQPVQAANLDNLAAAKGLMTKVTEPFPIYEPPAEMKVPEQTFGRLAFALTAEEPFATEPVVGEDAVYVIGLKRKVPSELPPFESRRDKVEEDYRRQQAQTLARQAGAAFHSALTNALAQGKSFEDVAKEQKVDVLQLAPFSQITRSVPQLEGRPEFSTIKNVALTLAPGEISSFTPTGSGGVVVRLKSRLELPELRVKTEVPNYLANLRRSRQAEAFSEWFRKELELAKMNLPGSSEDRTAQ